MALTISQKNTLDLLDFWKTATGREKTEFLDDILATHSNWAIRNRFNISSRENYFQRTRKT